MKNSNAQFIFATNRTNRKHQVKFGAYKGKVRAVRDVRDFFLFDVFKLSVAE
jgi:hypothetical protein